MTTQSLTTDTFSPEFDAPSIDVFITYRCGLRCSHCFVGSRLDTNKDLEFSLFEKLVFNAHNWHTRDLTFLGGEPTLYPHLDKALQLAHAEGYKTRIVTNGHYSYSRFISSFTSATLPFVCFSIDGSTADIHDLVRGRGSLAVLLQNVELSRSLGYRLSGIIAISRQNAHDVEALLRLCDSLNFEYVNVHYVTNRGFATPAMVLSVDEWRNICATVKEVAHHLRTKIRLERTFYDSGTVALDCALRTQSNLMLLPDGRMYGCMMFIDIPESHSYLFSHTGMLINASSQSEQRLVQQESSTGCPAMRHVNEKIDRKASRRRLCIQCMYAEETL
jgi:MoaA/NifB/PqqE/SkfB family radical SAM enzyme